MSAQKKILVRLPNWLGDLVMSTAFVQQLREWEPDAHIGVIVRDNLSNLALSIPGIDEVHPFSKQVFGGVGGATRFGRQFKQDGYDLFFCLPDSFSSATMAAATGAKVRIGHKKEMRGFLLTHALTKPRNKHRVDEYLDLLTSYYKQPVIANSVHLEPRVALPAGFAREAGKPLIICNFNSEAQSRRVPAAKAAAIAIAVRSATSGQIVLVGSPKEVAHTTQIADMIGSDVLNMAGKTNLPQLASLMAEADLTVTTDSGPAHLSNAMHCPVIVFFGAGDPRNTAPWNPDKRTIVKGATECSCPLRNNCKWDEPPCLTSLDHNEIANTAKQLLAR